ncbi:MAG: hypothetical protein WC454_09240 [Phycisphaerae bacterium]
MLGWEFPPFISGGLGAACYRLTKSMSNLGTEIVLVLGLQTRFRKNIVEMLRISKVYLDLCYGVAKLPLSSCFPRLLTSCYYSRVSLLVTVSRPFSVYTYTGRKILPRLKKARRRSC